ncbi:2-oxo acid dehydrogenase subunit E2 [Streptomyces sp. NBC_01190]|uniref:dihydrolipoamide acetyltransferase family protein n=1 Tax=Streptomyces sp. NBC_01190 TaxID=2903767 RepID=UPI00386DCFC0
MPGSVNGRVRQDPPLPGRSPSGSPLDGPPAAGQVGTGLPARGPAVGGAHGGGSATSGTPAGDPTVSRTDAFGLPAGGAAAIGSAVGGEIVAGPDALGPDVGGARTGRGPSVRRPLPESGPTGGAADDPSAGTLAPEVGPHGRRHGSPQDGGPQDGPVAVISPLVRRLARERGLDLRRVSGSGPDGLILRADVERAAAREVDGEVSEAPTVGVGKPVGQVRTQDGAERIPLRGIRGAVAEKLARSRREIPEATCWVDADATELLAVRAAMNAAGQGAGAERISVLALLARITTAALARHPELNATVDTERNEIVRLPAVHLGFAAQTERGLVVPVVRDAGSRSTAGLSAEIGRLTRAAREGVLTPGELTGGTFTLNNYGVFGVDGSTPIINHPEAAMLGIGRIVPKPWVYRGELAVRQVVQLSFTFDHRVCDGGVAGGFLRFVADCVENPAVLLAAV